MGSSSRHKIIMRNLHADPETACTGVILAGGQNTRFSGKNKAFVHFDGRRIMDRLHEVFSAVFSEMILVTNQPMDYLEWDLTIARDVYPVRSSLTGIHAGLRYARTPFVFVTACDTPFLKKEIVEAVLSRITPEVSVVVPETPGGIEPLCAAYAKTCLPVMEQRIKARKFQIRQMFSKWRVRKIPEAALRVHDPELMSFFNINTARDYSVAKEWAEKHPAGGAQ
jgi:molybdopterin-guanine dinucleotide biosynthesis protein A